MHSTQLGRSIRRCWPFSLNSPVPKAELVVEALEHPQEMVHPQGTPLRRVRAEEASREVREVQTLNMKAFRQASQVTTLVLSLLQ